MARHKAIPKRKPEEGAPPKDVEPEKKKKRRFRPGTVALREIKRYQGGTELLIGKAPIERLLKEIDGSLHPVRHRFKRKAIDALHYAAEEYLQELFTCTIKVALNSRSQTIRPQDLELAKSMVCFNA
jgi:histone H3/H4